MYCNVLCTVLYVHELVWPAEAVPTGGPNLLVNSVLNAIITKNGFSKGRKAQTEQKYYLDIIFVSSLGHVLPVNMAQGDLYCPVSPGHHPIADNSRHGCKGHDKTAGKDKNSVTFHSLPEKRANLPWPRCKKWNCENCSWVHRRSNWTNHFGYAPDE